MTDKILVWLGDALYRFGIAKSIDDQHDCELYSILDVDIDKKNFFEKQKLISFKKKWYFRDFVDVSKKQFDLEYVKKFEKKYEISLWNLAYSERYFYKFNTRQFTHDEILSLLEQECRFFENVLDKVKPDFLLIGTTDLHHNHLLSEMCRKLGIHVLTLTGARFGYREMICSKADKLDENQKINYHDEENSDSFENLKKYLKKYDTKKQIDEFSKNLRTPSSEKIRKFFKLIFVYSSKKYQNQFEYIDQNSSSILNQILKKIINKRKLKKFIDSNLKEEFDNTIPFIYFPLQTEPERSLSIGAPYYTNQIDVITNIAKSIPIQYKLFVKDHPGMAFKAGIGRNISFYSKIMELPNVELLHPNTSQSKILEKCSLVITINGTSGLEAAFYKKPAIILADTLYESLPSVIRARSYDELSDKINDALKTEVKPEHLKQFINFIEENSFIIDRKFLNSDFRNRFVYKEISENEINSYYNFHKKSFDLLAINHIKKINSIKNSR